MSNVGLFILLVLSSNINAVKSTYYTLTSTTHLEPVRTNCIDNCSPHQFQCSNGPYCTQCNHSSSYPCTLSSLHSCYLSNTKQFMVLKS